MSNNVRARAWALVVAVALALVVVPMAPAGTGAAGASKALTESEADDALHYGYAMEDLDRLRDLRTQVGQAEAEVAGLIAAGADATSIGVAQAEAEAARFRYRLEKRGHSLLLEDCLGLGKSIRVGLGHAFSRFRCRMSTIGNSGYIRETEVFSASRLRQIAAVPRPKGSTSAWSERLMEDRLVAYARLADPAMVALARQDVRAAEEELAGLRAYGASQASLKAAEARVRQAKRALAGAMVGVKLRSATCHGAGEPRTGGSRVGYVSFRCRVMSDETPAFMLVETRSPSRFLVRSVKPLAPR